MPTFLPDVKVSFYLQALHALAGQGLHWCGTVLQTSSPQCSDSAASPFSFSFLGLAYSPFLSRPLPSPHEFSGAFSLLHDVLPGVWSCLPPFSHKLCI